MSYEGEIVAAPVIAGAAVVAGAALVTAAVVKGAATAVSAAGKAVNTAINTAKLSSMNRDLKNITGEVDCLDEAMQAEMNAARDECYNEYSRTVDEVAEKCSESADMDAFLNESSVALQNLNNEIREKRSEIEKKYIREIRNEIRKQSSLMKSDRTLTEQSIQRMADDMEKRKLASQSAKDTLSRADEMINAVAERYGDTKITRNAVEICRSYYDRAISEFELGNYEAALISAHSAMDAITLRVEELAVNEVQCSQRYIDIMGILNNTSELMEKFRTTEYTISKRTGDKVVTVDNFTEYYRGAYKESASKLEDVKRIISDGDFRNHSPEELEDLFTRVTEIQSEFIRETTLANERLDIERKRKATAKHLMKEYLEQGYEMVSLTDEERAVSSMDSTILKFRNPETDETVRLRLNSVDQGGHIAMTVDIEDHTDYGGNSDEVERQREELRKHTCGVIEKKTGGRMRVKQMCKNPGARLK